MKWWRVAAGGSRAWLYFATTDEKGRHILACGKVEARGLNPSQQARAVLGRANLTGCKLEQVEGLPERSKLAGRAELFGVGFEYYLGPI